MSDIRQFFKLHELHYPLVTDLKWSNIDSFNQLQAVSTLRNDHHTYFNPPVSILVTYPALVVSGLLVKLGVLLPLGMTFLSRRTQVAMSTFI